MVEVMKVMVPCTSCGSQCPWPSSRPPPPTPPPETSGHSLASLLSLLCGDCCVLLGSGTHKVLFVPSKSLFPQSCVSSGRSMVELMATSSKRAYAIPRYAAPRVPVPAAGHCWPIPPQETLKQFWLSLCGVSGSQCAQSLFEPPSVSGSYVVWF